MRIMSLTADMQDVISSPTFLAFFATFASIIYLGVLAFYRLRLSPLAKIPGPKIAAITGFYEFYHDFFRRGQYVWRIADMHTKYGTANSSI